MNMSEPYAHIQSEIDQISFDAEESRREIGRLNTKAEVLEAICRKLKLSLGRQIDEDKNR
jgi:hypothetical protein